MIIRPHTGRLRAGFALLASMALPALCLAQNPTPPPNQPDPSKALPPKVYSNPRAGADDPRIGLKPGLYDAGEAIFGLEKVASMPKPAGFAPDPNAPEPPPPPTPPGGRGRGPTLNTGSTNSDLAFSGNHLFVGNYYGINFYDIDNPAQIKLGTSLVCPGGQGDVSVYGHLLFMSAEAMNGRIDCGTQGIPVPAATTPPPAPEPPPRRPPEPPADLRLPQSSAAARHRLPAPTVSAGCAFSISAISRTPSR